MQTHQVSTVSVPVAALCVHGKHFMTGEHVDEVMLNVLRCQLTY